MVDIIAGFILVILILLVIIDFIVSCNRNKELFGSDFFFDTMNGNSRNKKGRRSTNATEKKRQIKNYRR